MSAETPARPPRLDVRRRAGRALRWLVPGVVLALIPKCPACLAAYIALGTGLAVSFSFAEVLRYALSTACLGALAWLAFARLRKIHPHDH